ncbi:costars family protein ABRACL isoform X2 [Achlya hypogyna]|uniref:Costars family protein ABRACL isoform X2 n=1 Tax=Achlya hypogyna TaxID=1202772 RepID=A0A1V9YE86_ACHHY|nr:costars family protein ABRACL isoform X2 [Achlya hypogyna]
MEVDKEVEQLAVEIRRLGTTTTTADGKTVFGVTFGELFDDERCVDLFEALMGTLRAAKRKKVIDYPGQLLLKGVNDKVFITLLQG